MLDVEQRGARPGADDAAPFVFQALERVRKGSKQPHGVLIRPVVVIAHFGTVIF